ncbi:hypothetical protein EK904_011511 [Melospiza melodia maxima]|nr:hypothetical protein EK904_011511 [Melospiza melodia maxima]
MALCLKQVFNKDKTFRPRKKFEPGTQRFELYKKAQASLKSGLDLKAVVQLPPGESINDWIAVHVVDFFNRINLIYGTMSEYCTERSCPIMSGGLKYEYRWQDDSKYKKPTKLSAPQYMCMLMDWIEMLINNEDVFPTRIGEWALVPCRKDGLVTGAGSQAGIDGLCDSKYCGVSLSWCFSLSHPFAPN